MPSAQHHHSAPRCMSLPRAHTDNRISWCSSQQGGSDCVHIAQQIAQRKAQGPDIFTQQCILRLRAPRQSHLHCKHARGGASRHAPASTDPCCISRAPRAGAPPRPLASRWLHPHGSPRGVAAAVICSPSAAMSAASLLLADQLGQKARPPALLVQAGRLSASVEDGSSSIGSLCARRTASLRMSGRRFEYPGTSAEEAESRAQRAGHAYRERQRQLGDTDEQRIVL